MADFFNIATRDGVISNKAYANIDGLWGPYESTNEAVQTITSRQRVVGKKFGVKVYDGSTVIDVKEYQWTGTGNEDYKEIISSNREYNSSTNTKGYYVINNNSSIEEQIVGKDNTIFEIRDNFDLKVGEVVEFEDLTTQVVSGSFRYHKSETAIDLSQLDEGSIVIALDGCTFIDNSNNDLGNVIPLPSSDTVFVAKRTDIKNKRYVLKCIATCNTTGMRTSVTSNSNAQNYYLSNPISLKKGDKITLGSGEIAFDKSFTQLATGGASYTMQSDDIVYIGKSTAASELYTNIDCERSITKNVYLNNTSNIDNIRYERSEALDIQTLITELQTSFPTSSIAATPSIILTIPDDCIVLNELGTVVIEPDTVDGKDYTLTQNPCIAVLGEDYSGSYVVGSSLTIPNNSVLKFNGGKILNGELIGNNTDIIADSVEIFNAVTLSNTWIVSEVPIEWFGGKANEPTLDNGIIINNAILICQKIRSKLVLNIGRYYCSTGIEITSSDSLPAIINGNGIDSTIISSSANIAVFFKGGYGELSKLTIENSLEQDTKKEYSNIGLQLGTSSPSKPCVRGNFTHIKIIKFGTGLNLDYEWCNNISAFIVRLCDIGVNISKKTTDERLRNFIIESCRNYGIFSQSGIHVTVAFAVIEGNGVGIRHIGTGNLTVINSYFEANSETSNLTAGYKELSDIVRDSYTKTINNVTYNENKDINGGHIIVGDSASYAQNVTIQGCYFGGYDYGQENAIIQANDNRKHYNDKVYIDKCLGLSIVGCFHLEGGVLITTANCFVHTINNNIPNLTIGEWANTSINSLNYGLSLYGSADFKASGQQIYKPFKIDTIQIEAPYGCQLYAGTGINVRRPSADAPDRYIEFKITDINYLRNFINPTIAMDYQLHKDAPDYKIKVEVFLCRTLNDSDDIYTMYSETRNNGYCKGVASKARYMFNPNNKYNGDYFYTGFKYFAMRISIANEDIQAWESAQTDYNGYMMLAVPGVYLYDGRVIPKGNRKSPILIDTPRISAPQNYQLLPSYSNTDDVFESIEGACIWDSNSKKPLFFNGTAWVDATGTPIS